MHRNKSKWWKYWWPMVSMIFLSNSREHVSVQNLSFSLSFIKYWRKKIICMNVSDSNAIWSELWNLNTHKKQLCLILNCTTLRALTSEFHSCNYVLRDAGILMITCIIKIYILTQLSIIKTSTIVSGGKTQTNIESLILSLDIRLCNMQIRWMTCKATSHLNNLVKRR